MAEDEIEDLNPSLGDEHNPFENKQVDEKIKWKKIKDAGKHKLLSDFKNPFEIDSDDNSSFAEARARLKKTGSKEISNVDAF